MNIQITKKIKWGVGLGLMAFLSLLPNLAKAQWCTATSYGNGTTYGGNIKSIEVINGAGTTVSSYSGLGDNTSTAVLNTGAPIDITAGETITIKLSGNGDGYGWGWGTYAGVWIDGDANGTFSIAECVADPQSGPFSQGKITNTTVTAKVQVPCASKTAKTRIRFRANFTYYPSYLTNNTPCNNPGCYGNQFDLEANIKPGTPPVAGFTPPAGPNYEKVNVTFNADNASAANTYKWNFNPPGTAGSGTPATAVGAKVKSKWTLTGAGPTLFDVKMVVDNCGIADSITKQVKIVKPTAIPVADFIASSNVIEIYNNVQFLDLSSNGAYLWAWTITSPTGLVYTSSVQNPSFTLDEVGKWSACLTSQNGVGPSAKLCKTKYVECTPPGQFYMGPNHLATNQKGVLYDNGGPDNPYTNNRKPSIDYFEILPCGAKEIRLKFVQLKLADAGDKLMIYDGPNASGKLISPAAGINGSNQTSYRGQTLKAFSGAMYITFETNGAGVDSGFICNFESDLLPPQKPKSSWKTDYNPAANGMNVTFTQNLAAAQGSIDYEWILDGSSIQGPGNFPTWNYTFVTDGSYQVCLRASTCNGDDTFCGKMIIVTPSAPGALDFTADNLRPKVGDVVSLTTTTDFANMFDWSIFPTTYTWVTGNNTSQSPQIKFTAGGAYTFTLKAWNSVGGKTATEKKLIKNKYVIALNYCIPPVDLLSSDIGITEVTLSKGANTLFDNVSTAGDFAFTDYSASVGANLTFGAKYDLLVQRKTNSNNVNYAAWIDFNIDGDFDDAGEQIMNSGSISTTSATGSFNVPSIANSFVGITKMRVGAAYSSFNNTPCGTNAVGEFEDYRITLANDNKPPVITLVGKDTVRVEKGSTATSCYAEVAGTTYSAYDSTEGSLTSKVVVTTDLDCTVPGIYSFEFNLTDASGNVAVPKRRTVVVVLDKTAPVLTLQGVSPMTVEQCSTFTDPGAVANDLIDGNLTTAIVVTGSVNTAVVGVYTLTYTVMDAQGNTAVLKRIVNVTDTKKPGIFKIASRIVNNTTYNVQILSVFVDDIYAQDACNGALPISKIAGFNGPVNTAVRATYPIAYFAKDPSGNNADENGYVLNYKVDDYIPPVIELNTDDTILHDVNDPYYSRAVTVTDNYYPLNKLSVTKTGVVDPYTLGIYAETYTATDESGNVTVHVRYVKVVDRVAPVMVAPALNTCIGVPFWAMSGVLVTDNYYSPNTLLPMIKVVNSNINIWQPGVYYINYELTDPSGNDAAMITRNVFVAYAPNCQNTFTGVKDLKLDEAVNVFPNPTSGKITISYTLTNSNPLNIEVYNIAGVKVTELSNIKGGIGNQQLDLGNYGSGAYLVRLTNNGETTTKRIVVTK